MEEKYGEKGDDMVDQISALPEEIIVPILSLLTMKEAARTSVLSHRWKNLWNTGSLDFDASKITLRMSREIGGMISLETERSKYMTWVNQVLDLHRGQTIEEFRLCFDLDNEFTRVIDRWLNFAMEKRVQRLEVDLRNDIDLTEDALARLLSDCPLIEELSLLDSQSLVNLKIGGPSLKLKYLELSYCFGLQNVEVSATNLVSFKCIGNNIKNPFKSVPLLSEVFIGGFYCHELVYMTFFYFSGVLSQLETLVLDLHYLVYDTSFVPKIFPEFRNLKQLELQLRTYTDQSILFLTFLIGACPSLYRLVVKLRYTNSPRANPEKLIIDKDIPCLGGKPRKGRIWPHQCLKVVELIGWVGHTIDVELAVFLLENALLLDKMIIDPRYPFILNKWDVAEFEAQRRESREAARERAKQLETKLPPGSELVIL